ncbi:EpsG family protein [Streptococcus hillyeri]|uniref:EpsG family protein n=1 Tax=Streptococcus hillyeri TaxID=2282420 RepID=UPI0034E2F7B7
MVIFYLIFISLLLLSFLFPKEKIVFVMNSLLLWILFAFNRGGADYIGYVAMFNAFGRENVKLDFYGDGIWKILNHVFYRLSFTVEEFLMVLLTCGVISYVIFIKKYSKNPNIVIALGNIYPLVDNIIQKRFFLAMVIAIWIVPVALRYQVSYKRWLYSAGLIYVSYTLHSSFALMFLLLIPIYLMNKEFNFRFIVYFSLLSFSLFALVFRIAPFLIESSKLNLYLVDESLKTSIWKLGIHVVITYLYVGIAYKIYKFQLKENSINPDLRRLLMWFSGGMSLFIPFIFYNSTFFRFPRLLFLFVFIMMANLFDVNDYKIKRNTFNILLILVCLQISMFTMMYVLTGIAGFNSLVRPLIESNAILEYLVN